MLRGDASRQLIASVGLPRFAYFDKIIDDET